MLPCRSAAIRWAPSSVDIRWWWNDPVNVFQIAHTCPWTLTCHFDKIAIHYYIPERNFQHNFRRLSITGTHSYATTRRPSRRWTYAILITHFNLETLGIAKSKPGQRKDREINCMNIQSVISSDKSAMASKRSIKRHVMDTCPVKTPWNLQNTSCSTSSINIGKWT